MHPAIFGLLEAKELHAKTATPNFVSGDKRARDPAGALNRILS
jgi:hypothetical protein